MSDPLGKKLAFVLLVVFLAITNIGVLATAGMMMEDGILHPCPHMDSPTLCAMDPIEHIAQWQQTFAAALPAAATIFLPLACAALLAVLGIHMSLRVDAYLVRHRERRRVRIRGPLSLAFACGIIHPKTF